MFLFGDAEPMSIPNLLTSLGSSGAVVVVVGYFLAFLRAEREKCQDLFQKSQESFAVALSELSDRHGAAVRGVEEKFQRVFDQQSSVINSVALSLKDTEATMRLNSAAIEHLERTVHSLHGFLERDRDRQPGYASTAETPGPG